MKIRALIVEDEKPASDRLIKLLKNQEPDTEIMGLTEGVEKTINWLTSNPDPDLIFMDIQLEDGICFEIFEAVKINVPVIFTTAYDAYALRAFKVNSIDYLLKPIDAGLLKKALDKYKLLYDQKPHMPGNLAALVANMLKQSYKERFFIKIGTHFRSVPSNEIACFLVSEKYTFLQTMTGQQYDLDHSLDQLEKLLNPESFMRVNRNYIIRINAINDIVAYSSSRLKIKLKNDPNIEGIIVSRERMQEFRKWMDR